MNINNIELRHLRYFLAVAEELNFSRAAKRLNLSQPPLSKQIADLEMRLETILFKRTKRKVELTNAGKNLLPRAKQILREVDYQLRSSHAVGRGQIGEIRIATIYSAPLSPHFVKTIRQLRKAAPHTRLSFHEMRATPVMQAIATDKADIGFNWHIAPLTDKRLSAKIISEDQLDFYLPSDHPFARKPILDLQDLKDISLFLTSLQTKMDFAATLKDLARKAAVTLSISEEVAHFPIIANLVAAGWGGAFLPNYIADRATERLVPKKIRGMKENILRMPLALIYRADDQNPLIQLFKKKPRNLN